MLNWTRVQMILQLVQLLVIADIVYEEISTLEIEDHTYSTCRNKCIISLLMTMQRLTKLICGSSTSNMKKSGNSYKRPLVVFKLNNVIS